MTAPSRVDLLRAVGRTGGATFIFEEGTVRVQHACYAQRRLLVRVVDKPARLAGWKGRLERLLHATDSAARWSNRESGYVMSPGAVLRFLERAYAGADANFFNGRLEAPEGTRVKTLDDIGGADDLARAGRAALNAIEALIAEKPMIAAKQTGHNTLGNIRAELKAALRKAQTPPPDREPEDGSLN